MTEKSENITTAQTHSQSEADPAPHSDARSQNHQHVSTDKIAKNTTHAQASHALDATSNGRMMRTLTIISVVFLVVIIISGSLAVRHQQQTNKELITSVTDLNSKINNLNYDAKIDQLSTTIQQTVDEHQTSSQNLSHQIQQLQQQQNELSVRSKLNQQYLQGDTHDWMQYEVMHLLRMASHRLTLSYDIAGATAALQAAQARIAELDDPALLDIIQSIQQQIKNLSQLTVLDVSNLHEQIDAIRNELSSALIDAAADDHKKFTSNKTTSTQEHTTTDVVEHTTSHPIWNASQSILLKLIESAKAFFNDSVQVTHGTQNSAEFLKHQNNRHTYEMVNIHLLEAQHAIAQRDNESYRQHLDAARQRIRAHPGFQHQASIIENIQTLSEINLTPPLPDISQPSNLLAEKMTQSKVSK